MTTQYVKIRNRYDTAANWNVNNPVLRHGEVGIESDTYRWKLGNGVTNWGSTPYIKRDSVHATYDNFISGLESTTVQEALIEVAILYGLEDSGGTQQESVDGNSGTFSPEAPTTPTASATGESFVRIMYLYHDTEFWEASEIILAKGELAFNLDTDKYKVGDGDHVWRDLPELGTFPASAVPYDNSQSGLSATNVQDAIDELVYNKSIQFLSSNGYSVDGDSVDTSNSTGLGATLDAFELTNSSNTSARIDADTDEKVGIVISNVTVTIT